MLSCSFALTVTTGASTSMFISYLHSGLSLSDVYSTSFSVALVHVIITYLPVSVICGLLVGSVSSYVLSS